MNEQTSQETCRAQIARKCPHCNEQICHADRLVDFGWYKKWVRRWQCPVHGQVDLLDQGTIDTIKM